nr:MAG TPA: hypothetical protein [Caudoviricetes sp.]
MNTLDVFQFKRCNFYTHVLPTLWFCFVNPMDHDCRGYSRD